MITGGPGSGKTTMVNLLKARGYKTTIENARHYFDMQRLNGQTVEEVRKHQEQFQLRVLEMQIEVEKALQPDEVVFLDRAIPDALAYYKYLNIIIDPLLADAMFKINYKKVFILDCLPLVQDYARTEDEEAQKKIHAVILSVYESLPFPIIRVPVMLPHERVDFILKNL